MSHVTLSLLAQTKIALHSARHGFSPIHGILIGRRSPSASSLVVTNVIPVCHEVPTRPVVNTALRLVDAYLDDSEEEILGWYTANSTQSEQPNVAALKIVSSMAEQCGEEMMLVLASVSQDGPICTVYERGSAKTFTQKVDASRVEMYDAQARHVVIRGIQEMSNFSSEYGEKGLTIYDYVDHVSNFEKKEDIETKDWIENTAATDFVARLEAR